MFDSAIVDSPLVSPFTPTLGKTTYIAIQIDLGTPPQRTWRQLKQEVESLEVDVKKEIQVVSNGVAYGFTFEDFLTRLGIPTE